jgi:hypothetical protein
MGAFAFVSALLAVAVLSQRLSPSLKMLLLVASLVLPLGGVFAELRFRDDAGRSRIDVQFLGYEVPLSNLNDCRTPSDPLGNSGLWIGGGPRWEADAHPDLIVVPGFRGHLLEVCRGANNTVTVRTASPGTAIAGGAGWTANADPHRFFRLLPADGIFFQRVVLDGASRTDETRWSRTDCFDNGTSTTSGSEIETFVEQQWQTDIATQRKTKTVRQTLRDYFESLPASERNYVFCVDVRGAPKRCDPRTYAPLSSAFLWRAGGSQLRSGITKLIPQLGHWDGLLAPNAHWQGCGTATQTSTGEQVTVTPQQLLENSSVSNARIRLMPSVAFRMIARRTLGGVADSLVPVDADRFSPAGFRLGPLHSVRFASHQNHLILFTPEASVQTRLDDLFGPSPLHAVPEGDFTLTFGSVSADDVLIANLASAADGHSPKPVLEHLAPHVRIPSIDARQFSLSLPAVSPRVYPIDSLVAIPADPGTSPDRQVRALVLFRRVSPPVGLLIIPSASTTLCLVALMWSRKIRDDWFWYRWSILSAMSALLMFRFLMTARVLADAPGLITDSPGSGESYISWTVAAFYLLVGPSLLFVPPFVRAAGGMAIFRARSTRWYLMPSLLLGVGFLFVFAAMTASSDLPTFNSIVIGAGGAILAWSIAVLFGLVAAWLFYIATARLGSFSSPQRNLIPWRANTIRLKVGLLEVAIGAVAVTVFLSGWRGALLLLGRQPPSRLATIVDLSALLLGSLLVVLARATQPAASARQSLLSLVAGAANLLRWALYLYGTGESSSLTIRAATIAGALGAAGALLVLRAQVSWPWYRRAMVSGVILLALRLGVLLLGFQEAAFGVRLDVLFLPMSAAGLAFFLNRSSQMQTGPPTGASILFALLAFGATGLLANDFGLLWVGGMTLVLALPFAAVRPLTGSVAAVILFLGLFLSPFLFPAPFQTGLGLLGGETTLEVNGQPTIVADPLEVNRDRDHYRMLDAVAPEATERIPAQLAREVVLERERLRYQALEGAWRQGFRGAPQKGGAWFGAGLLRARPLVGESTFAAAARSDYVYQLYLRAEFGTIGVVAVALLYGTLFLAGALTPSTLQRPFAAATLAIASGTALYMLGGTHGLFPFSGKWPLLLTVGSMSDASLGFALILLACVQES